MAEAAKKEEETEKTKKAFGVLDLIWLVRDTRLGLEASAKQVLMALIQRSDATKGFTCFPSISTIAADCECSEDTVERRLKMLEKVKLISITPRIKDGKRISSVYGANVDKLRLMHDVQQAVANSVDLEPDDPQSRYTFWLTRVRDLEKTIEHAQEQEGEAWGVYLEHLVSGACTAYATGGLSAVKFPHWLGSEHMEEIIDRLFKGVNPPLDAEKSGYQLEWSRGDNGEWTVRFEPDAQHRGMTEDEIAVAVAERAAEDEKCYVEREADYRRAEEEFARRCAEAGGKDVYVAAYKARQEIECWDDRYAIVRDWPRFQNMTKVDVISALREEERGPYISTSDSDIIEHIASEM